MIRLSPVQRLILSLAVVFIVLIAGTFGYMTLTDQPLLPSLYMTVITLSTVGFSETIPLDPSGRLLTIGIIVFGGASVSISLAFLVSMVVGGEFMAIQERRRMRQQIDEMRDHVIICGLGRMGRMIVRQLSRENIACVSIDLKEQDEADLIAIKGDATEDSVLEQAGISRARALVACLSKDADNVYVTLSARGLHPQLTIISRSELPSTEPKLIRAGADSVISPQTIGANKTVQMLCRPHVVELVDMASRGVDIEIAQLEVETGSALIDKRLRSSGIRERTGTMVVAIKRADNTQIFSPGPDEMILGGDRLILIGRGGLSERLADLHL